MWFHLLYCFSFPLLCSKYSATISFTVSYIYNVLSMSNQSHISSLSFTSLLCTFYLPESNLVSQITPTFRFPSINLLRMEALSCSISGCNHYWRIIALHFIVNRSNATWFSGSDLCLLSLAFICYPPTSHTLILLSCNINETRFPNSLQLLV